MRWNGECTAEQGAALGFEAAAGLEEGAGDFRRFKGGGPEISASGLGKEIGGDHGRTSRLGRCASASRGDGADQRARLVSEGKQRRAARAERLAYGPGWWEGERALRSGRCAG